MGFWGKIFGGSIADPIEALGNAIDKVVTSDEERLQAEAVLEKLRQKPFILQAELNKIAASHRSIFVAGGRPFILWMSGINWTILLWTIILVSVFKGNSSSLPILIEGFKIVTTAMASVLGIYGGFRTVEKLTNKAK